MDDGLYNGLLLAVASLAALGTIASSITNAFNIKSIQDIGKYGDYYGMRFTTGSGKMRVLSFHTHAHSIGPQGIWGYHWTLQKFDPKGWKTAATIARWIWWSLRHPW